MTGEACRARYIAPLRFSPEGFLFRAERFNSRRTSRALLLPPAVKIRMQRISQLLIHRSRSGMGRSFEEAGVFPMTTPSGEADLIIRDLHASVDGKEILRGVNLEIRKGETHALMGPNGSGKSTLANVIMGHPRYDVTQGEILFKGHNILELSPDKRARMGLFLAFQYPSSVPGVTLSNFLRSAYAARQEGYDPDAPEAPSGDVPKQKRINPSEFRKL